LLWLRGVTGLLNQGTLAHHQVFEILVRRLGWLLDMPLDCSVCKLFFVNNLGFFLLFVVFLLGVGAHVPLALFRNVSRVRRNGSNDRNEEIDRRESKYAGVDDGLS